MRNIFIILFSFFAFYSASSQTERFPQHKRCSDKLTNKELKKCSTEKIMNFVKMSFDMELANRLFPQENSTKFNVKFNINKKGKIENITAKAFKREIAVEAIKILKRHPKFKNPGLLNGKPVDTPFDLIMTIYFLN